MELNLGKSGFLRSRRSSFAAALLVAVLFSSVARGEGNNQPSPSSLNLAAGAFKGATGRMISGEPDRAVGAFRVLSDCGPDIPVLAYSYAIAAALSGGPEERTKALPAARQAFALAPGEALHEMAVILLDPALSAREEDRLRLSGEGARRLELVADRLGKGAPPQSERARLVAKLRQLEPLGTGEERHYWLRSFATLRHDARLFVRPTPTGAALAKLDPCVIDRMSNAVQTVKEKSQEVREHVQGR